MNPETKGAVDQIEQFARERLAALCRITDHVIAIAAGSLSITIAFRASIAGPAGAWLIKTAWFLMAITIITGLWSKMGEVMLFQKLIERYGAHREIVTAEAGPSHLIATIVSFVSFGAAVLALAIYGAINL